MKTNILICLFVTFSFAFSFSQKKDFVIEKIDGVKYYIHKVEKGNTLYSISKKYGVLVSEIAKYNPESTCGLRIGQTIKIPVDKVKTDGDEEIEIEENFLIHKVKEKETLYSISKKYNLKPKDIIENNPETASKDIHIGQLLKIPLLKSPHVSEKDILPAIEDTLINHTVKKGETLFSLAKLYNVNIDSIHIVNQGIKSELRENQLVRIPKLRIEKKIPAFDFFSKRAIVLKDNYSVALMLPFYTDVNDSIERNLKFSERSYIYKDSEFALMFYEGAVLALDSLAKSGVSVKLFVYDTKNDTSEIKTILSKNEIEKMDLIIGPTYQYLFEPVAAFAKNNEIGIVCPVPQSAKILLDNKFASKITASPLLQTDQLAEFVLKNHNKKILLFTSNEKTDMRLAQSFLKKADEVISHSGKTTSEVVKDFYFADINADKIKLLLSLSDTNIIVVPSHNQPFVSEILSKLNGIADEKYAIIVFGLDKWSDYENIDIKYLHNLQVQIASPSFVDYDNQKDFVKSFRHKYKTDPDKFAFLGFDVAMYYLTALQKYGKNFYDYLPEYKKNDSYSYSFDFIKTGYESGCENKHVFILKYENFNLVRVQ